MINKKLNNDKLFKFADYFKLLFFWLYIFYPKAKKVHYLYLLVKFFPQKILRINGKIPWPVHFTSKVLHYKNISLGVRSLPGNNIGGYIQAKNGIIIGSNFRMGPHVGLISADHDIDNYDQWKSSKSIKIGDNVWIGMNSIVLSGVSIGNNVVIGANSTVTKNIPNNSIAVGSPCVVVKKKDLYKGKTYKD